MRPAKPLWGFGWAGWCLLPVAAGLAWVYFTGYDLRFQLLWAINETLGWTALAWFVTVPLVGHWFGIREPEFNAIALMYVLIAMHLYPRRIRWWWYAAVVAGALLAPALPWIIISWPRSRAWATWGTMGLPSPLDMPGLAANLAMAAVLWRMTGSLRVGLWAAGLMIAAAAFGWWIDARSSARALGGFEAWLAQYATAPLWHAGLAGALLAWGISARRRTPPPWQCRSCGYDMRGLTGAPCPECGASLQSESAMPPTG